MMVLLVCILIVPSARSAEDPQLKAVDALLQRARTAIKQAPAEPPPMPAAPPVPFKENIKGPEPVQVRIPLAPPPSSNPTNRPQSAVFSRLLDRNGGEIARDVKFIRMSKDMLVFQKQSASGTPGGMFTVDVDDLGPETLNQLGLDAEGMKAAQAARDAAEADARVRRQQQESVEAKARARQQEERRREWDAQRDFEASQAQMAFDAEVQRQQQEIAALNAQASELANAPKPAKRYTFHYVTGPGEIPAQGSGEGTSPGDYFKNGIYLPKTISQIPADQKPPTSPSLPIRPRTPRYRTHGPIYIATPRHRLIWGAVPMQTGGGSQ